MYFYAVIAFYVDSKYLLTFLKCNFVDFIVYLYTYWYLVSLTLKIVNGQFSRSFFSVL